MRKLSVLLALVGASLSAVAYGAVGDAGTPNRGEWAADIKSRLVGSWQLRSFVQVNEQGDVIAEPYGRNPQGEAHLHRGRTGLGVYRRRRCGEDRSHRELVHGHVQDRRPAARGNPHGALFIDPVVGGWASPT